MEQKYTVQDKTKKKPKPNNTTKKPNKKTTTQPHQKPTVDAEYDPFPKSTSLHIPLGCRFWHMFTYQASSSEVVVFVYGFYKYILASKILQVEEF